MKGVILMLVVLSASCASLKGYKKKEFAYGGTDTGTLELLIPSGYTAEKIAADSAGNKQHVYTYGDALLYFVHLADTTKSYQSIDTASNIPLPNYNGGLQYKGVSKSGLFWREIRQGSFRFGYTNVPSALEVKFDSSVNYANVRRVKK